MSVLPNNTFISPYNSFYGQGNNNVIPSTINTQTINASSINASTINVSTLNALLINNSSINVSTLNALLINNSSINVVTIDIDGQILTANGQELLLNGIPIATTSNISSIADWSLVPAISSINCDNWDLINVNQIYLQTDVGYPQLQLSTDPNSINLYVNNQPVTAGNAGNAANWSQYPCGSDVNCAQYNLTNVKNISSSGIVGGTQLNINNTTGTARLTTDATGTNLYVNGAVVATGGSASNWSHYAANTPVDYGYNPILNTNNISLISSISALGSGVLTVNETGTSLLFNGQPVQFGTTSNVADWSLFSAISTIQCISSGAALYTPGELNILGGSLNLETTAQLGASTNSVLIADTGVRITGDNGIYLGANGGVQIGGLGGVSVSAVGGVAVSAGALFTVNVAGIVSLIAGGAINLAAIGAASLAATGPINIGSIAYTSLEQIRIDDSLITRDNSTSGRIRIHDLSELQANNDGGGAGPLKLIGKDVGILVSTSYGLLMNAENNNAASTPIQIRTSGATGSGLGTTFYTMEQDFDPNTQSMIYTSGTQNTSNVLPPFNRKYITTCYNVLSNSSTFNTLSENYDGISTISYTNTSGTVDIKGITTIGASNIVGNVGSFSTLLTSASTIRLGAQPGVGIALGNNSIGIGYLSQPAGSNSVGIGYNAGNESGIGNVFIGQEAGVQCGNYNVGIGYKANFLGGSGNVVINATSTILVATANDSTYIKPLRNVSTQPAGTSFAMAYVSTTSELLQTNTKVSAIESTIQNTQQITYDTGLLTTTIDGILKINGSATATQSLTANTTFDSLQVANLSSLTLNGIPLSSFTNALQYNSTTKEVSYFPVTNIVAAPSFVYYVSKNGRAGASGSITDPLSTIAEALTKPASTGPTDPPGMVIYVSPGSYPDDIAIPISLTLPSVSIIGMSTDTDDSKQVQIRGAITISATDVTLVNTVNTVTINNIALFAKNGTTTAITMSGRGYRVYLQNGLYTTPFAMSVPLLALSSTGVSTNSVVQLVVNNCSMSMPSGSSGNIISVASGQLFEIKDSDLTQRGSGLTVGVTGGTFSSANNSNFESTAGGTVSLAFTVAGLANFTNCLLRGLASPTVAILTCGANANLNLSNCTIQNTNTVEANNTSRYVYLTAGVLVASIRNNFSSSATTPITQMTPYQGTTPASSALFYFANIYTNASNTVEENLPVWVSVRQFSNDLLIPQFQVVATSATPIALNASARGKTFILTGVTTQSFTTTGLTATDAGLAVIVHNGNATGVGDINITGATGTTIVHNRTATANGGVLYLFWNGTSLVGY